MSKHWILSIPLLLSSLSVSLHREMTSLVSRSECNSHKTRGFKGLSNSHLFCLSGMSTYLFTATYCAQQDTRTRAPDWHFGGGMGCEASLHDDHGHFDAVLSLAHCEQKSIIRIQTCFKSNLSPSRRKVRTHQIAAALQPLIIEHQCCMCVLNTRTH